MTSEPGKRVIAKRGKLDNIDKAAPLIQRLRETGLYVSGHLVERLLAEVGE